MWPQEQFCSPTQVRRPVLQQPFRLSAYVQRACSLRHPARILAGIDPADFICNGISFLFAVPAVMGTAFFYAFFWMLIKMQLALPFAGWAGGARSLDRPLRQYGPGMFRYWIKYGEFPRNIRRNLRK